MKQIQTSLAGLNNLKSTKHGLLGWVKHNQLWIRRPMFYEFNSLDGNKEGGVASYSKRADKRMLDSCSLQTEEAMIPRMADKARSSYSTKQRRERRKKDHSKEALPALLLCKEGHCESA